MELLDEYAEAAGHDAAVAGGLSVEALEELPDPIRTRVIRAAIVAAGAPSGETFHQHVLAVDALVTDWHGQRWVDLPGRLRAVRHDGVLGFAPAGSPA
jgi:tRNA(Ile)-lysidine synthase